LLEILRVAYREMWEGVGLATVIIAAVCRLVSRWQAKRYLTIRFSQGGAFFAVAPTSKVDRLVFDRSEGVGAVRVESGGNLPSIEPDLPQ
jgi:hypothetical protein